MSFVDKSILFLLGIFCLSFLLLFPGIPLITDEISYFNQAFSLLGNEVDRIEANYPLGTSLFLIPWIALFGKKAVFLSGLVYFIGSFLFLFKAIQIQKGSSLGIILLFSFLPLQFLSRGLMSEMPSLFLISAGIYLFFKKPNSFNLFFMALVTGLSLAFRETNILLMFPLLANKTFKNKGFLFASVLGITSGVSFRLISAFLIYGNAFFIKSSFPFSLQYIPDNFWVYFIVVIALIPLSPIWIYHAKAKNLSLLKFILIAFITLHLCYGYNASYYSGIKQALILNGRFIIPALPFFVILLATFFKQYTFPKWFVIFLVSLGGIISVGSQYFYYQKQKEHVELAIALNNNIQKAVVIFDQQYKTSIQRYINPYFGLPMISYDLETVIHSNHLEQILEQYSNVKLVLALREENELKSSRAHEQLGFLQKIQSDFRVVPDMLVRSKDGLQISTYLVTAN